MIFSKNHNFAMPEENDDVVDSIKKYAENFNKLDDLLSTKTSSLSTFLVSDKLYDVATIIYNNSPSIGDYLGWVNIRTGKHAGNWTPLTNYKVNDVVIPVPNNGHFYRCTIDGISSPIQPTFPTSVGVSVDDTYGILSWSPSNVYNIGDIVKSTSGGGVNYYRCTKAGTSSATEPLWSPTTGVTVVDGNVNWMVCKKAVWVNESFSCEFRPYGKIE